MYDREAERTSYPQEGIAADNNPRAATITNKASRILEKIKDAENLARNIAARTVPPTPQKDAAEAPPSPAHIVFILEEADRRLDSLCKNLDFLGGIL